MAAAKKITNPEKGIYGFGAPLDMQQGYDNFIFQNGGEVLSADKTKSGFDTPAVKEAMQWYREALLKAFTGEVSVSDACDEAAKKVNEILATEK